MTAAADLLARIARLAAHPGWDLTAEELPGLVAEAIRKGLPVPADHLALVVHPAILSHATPDDAETVLGYARHEIGVAS